MLNGNGNSSLTTKIPQILNLITSHGSFQKLDRDLGQKE
jgi:hypothetical protein